MQIENNYENFIPEIGPYSKIHYHKGYKMGHLGNEEFRENSNTYKTFTYPIEDTDTFKPKPEKEYEWQQFKRTVPTVIHITMNTIPTTGKNIKTAIARTIN